MPAIEQIRSWVIQHLEGTLSDGDRVELMDWVGESDANRMAVAEFLEETPLHEGLQGFYQSREKIWERLDTAIGERPAHVAPIHRVHFIRRWWSAAAIVLLLAGGVWLWKERQPKSAPSIGAAPTQDLPPGGNKAILTLSGGRQVILDSTSQDTVLTEGAAIVAGAKGKLAYNAGNSHDAAMVYNTLTTPRGGQYQLILPDGTKVWLNAASSITYPTAFTGPDRKVTITGEAYLEVFKNVSKPFKVSTKDEVEVEVLGTSFNVNAYGDESNIKTTLLDGSVRVAAATSPFLVGVNTNKDKLSVVLKPGQQAQVVGLNNTNNGNQVTNNGKDGNPGGEKVKVLSDVDVDQVIAWKNGIFNFDHADLPAVLRQLSRWYDLDVRYQGAVPTREFMGKLPRDLNLSQILNVLTEMNIDYRVERHTLLIEK